MELQFYGAVRSVTGSMHMLHANGHQVLMECGMYQGKRAETTRRNRNLPFDASKVDACTLSHAHIDHSGNLPNLVKSGYKGRVLATHATADLAKILLEDSAHIQAKDVEYVNRKESAKAKKSGKRHTPVEPIYSKDDARETAQRFDTIDYGKPVQVCPGVRLTFYDAGHILGSGVGIYEVEEGGRTVRVGFTGDLGRPRQPILRDPQPLPKIDYLITESTYGNRVHEATESMKEKLLKTVSDTFERGGRLIIPAFSVGRTQNLCYYLSELFHEGLLPQVPVFVDSPLAIDATHAYRDHSECYDMETLELMRDGGNPFGFEQLTYTRKAEESIRLNTLDEPCVVIAASGMCEGGRVLHHLKHGVGKPENTVLIVGFQAHHTLGRRLVEGAPKLRIYGQEHRVRCEVKKMNGFSAHADRDELRTYIKHIPGLKKVFVVHGEEEASFAFASYLMQIGIKAHVPVWKERVEL
jgi:metallo-beta-lactamase family protein